MWGKSWGKCLNFSNCCFISVHYCSLGFTLKSSLSVLNWFQEDSYYPKLTATTEITNNLKIIDIHIVSLNFSCVVGEIDFEKQNLNILQESIENEISEYAVDFKEDLLD